MRIKNARGRLCGLLVAALVATGLTAVPAMAAPPGAHWTVMAQSAPTYFHAGDTGDYYEVIAINDGGGEATGPTTVIDTLPEGVIEKAAKGAAENEQGLKEMACTPRTTGGVTTVTCEAASGVGVGRIAHVKIDVEVPPNATGTLTDAVTVMAGGVEASATNATRVAAAGESAPYGAAMKSELTASSGNIDTQAGAHPFALTTTVAFNIAKVTAGEPCGGFVGVTGCPIVSGDAKDIEVKLPPGLVGNPTATPTCTMAEFEQPGNEGCPADTQVGLLYLVFGNGTAMQVAPVYNVEPPGGQPAELGFSVAGNAHVPMLFHVRSSGDYGLTADLLNVSEADPVVAALLSIWGVPSAEAHDPLRDSSYGKASCSNGCEVQRTGRPFLTLPSSCSATPLAMAIATDPWQQPGAMVPGAAPATLPGMTGCESLSLGHPSIGVQPETPQAGSPSGYGVSLKVPQNEEAEGLATPDIKNVEVTMPEGTVISPSAANGLQSCSDALFGLHAEGAGECPAQSKIGKVTIHTPLLATPLEGSVYVGEPECGAGGICSPQQAREGKMVRLLIEAHGSGVLVKLAGRTEIDQARGRLTTVFENNPQLPFDSLELEIEGGQDAPLVNPATCGPLKARATLTAWSAIANAAGQITDPGSLANVEPESPVSTTGCKPAGFSPSFEAGMTKSSRGGSFSGFAVTLSRADGQQTLGAVSTHLPPGVSGMISKVPECANADANAGTCSAASQIGTATTVVGPGSQPYTMEGGKVFLTGPYGGGPFGLAIVVPDKAGPYTLAGNTGRGYQVVRASIAVDPHTAAVTVTTVPLPTQIDGIPLNIRKVIVNIDREGFMLNPTDCNATAITGTIASSNGTAANVSYPFQAVNCAALRFKPTFSALIHAHHTRKNGEYMHVVVKSGAGQANIGRVHVTLPGKLPARLGAALKNACTVAQFDTNPAGCPAQAIVGHATARTPILPVPMQGPAIFVSHGGAGFPDLVLLLQGDGVHITLTGKTFIRKLKGNASITTTTFGGVPDVPISRFDLVLPAGSNSALAGNGNMCAKPLYMPTVITGQNGKVLKHDTKVQVTGCTPELHVVKTRRRGARAKIVVQVPSAGKLVANGRGIERDVKKTRKAKRVTLTVSLRRQVRRMLRHHHHRRLKVTVRLRFHPRHGRRISDHVSVLMR